MLHVDEDTNDELFRKAAEDYSLSADMPDWEKLLNKINVIDPGSINETIHQKKKKQYRLLLLFSGPHSIFRIFKFSSWLEKSKKKIDVDVLHLLNIVFLSYEYFFRFVFFKHYILLKKRPANGWRYNSYF